MGPPVARDTPRRAAVLALMGMATGTYGAILWILGVPHQLLLIALSAAHGAIVAAMVTILFLLWPIAASASLVVVGGWMLLRHRDGLRPADLA